MANLFTIATILTKNGMVKKKYNAMAVQVTYGIVPIPIKALAE